MSDLLAQLREERALHYQNKSFCHASSCDDYWPCRASRALDCAIAGWEFVTEDAEESCSYGDGCPNNEGTRHGRCRFCKAKLALAAAGIARHQPVTDPSWPTWQEKRCRDCMLAWPCETLKALQGWRAAVVEGERLRVRLKKWEDEESHEAMSCYLDHTRLEAAEAKLKDAEQHHADYHYYCSAKNNVCPHEAPLKDAEEKMRGLVEAAQRVVDRCELSGGWKAMNALEEALTQAKREGE